VKLTYHFHGGGFMWFSVRRHLFHIYWGHFNLVNLLIKRVSYLNISNFTTKVLTT